MQAPKAFSILLAEDDSDDRTLFREAVAVVNENICVLEALTGIQTIDILQQAQHLPDLLILDINMPLINGIECLRIIREDERLKELPVLIMSTSGNEISIRNAQQAGANRYAVKPPCFDELVMIVRLLRKTDWSVLKDSTFVLNQLIGSASAG